MVVYRIVHKSHSHSLYAPGINGRWNSGGRKVIYTAQTISLAFMENMVRRAGYGFNNLYTTMMIDIPGRLEVLTINAEQLPKNWRDFRDYSQCQKLGDKWFDERKYPVLKVPSAVLPLENNFVINTLHGDFQKIKLLGTLPIIPDERIEKLLKYK